VARREGEGVGFCGDGEGAREGIMGCHGEVFGGGGSL